MSFNVPTWLSWPDDDEAADRAFAATLAAADACEVRASMHDQGADDGGGDDSDDLAFFDHLAADDAREERAAQRAHVDRTVDRVWAACEALWGPTYLLCESFQPAASASRGVDSPTTQPDDPSSRQTASSETARPVYTSRSERSQLARAAEPSGRLATCAKGRPCNAPLCPWCGPRLATAQRNFIAEALADFAGPSIGITLSVVPTHHRPDRWKLESTVDAAAEVQRERAAFARVYGELFGDAARRAELGISFMFGTFQGQWDIVPHGFDQHAHVWAEFAAADEGAIAALKAALAVDFAAACERHGLRPRVAGGGVWVGVITHTPARYAAYIARGSAQAWESKHPTTAVAPQVCLTRIKEAFLAGDREGVAYWLFAWQTLHAGMAGGAKQFRASDEFGAFYGTKTAFAKRRAAARWAARAAAAQQDADTGHDQNDQFDPHADDDHHLDGADHGDHNQPYEKEEDERRKQQQQRESTPHQSPDQPLDARRDGNPRHRDHRCRADQHVGPAHEGHSRARGDDRQRYPAGLDAPPKSTRSELLFCAAVSGIPLPTIYNVCTYNRQLIQGNNI